MPEVDIVVAAGERAAGTPAEGSVAGAGGRKQGSVAQRGVVGAGGVDLQRLDTKGGVRKPVVLT